MYTPVIGTLAFIMSPDGRKTLLVHRHKRQSDQHLGKYNGLGGKLEAGEDVLSCIKREIREEAGLECREIILRGTISWPGFGPNNEDWFGFIFRVDAFSGEPLLENEEGTLSWYPINQLDKLPMWEGDRHFLPLVFDRNPVVFHGVLPYENSRPVSWHYTRI
ncbi:MAG: 8-oxo-dGTP diphosphatase [Deltaproteobacteria bacterium]|nr:8-oxo-dGTP diphosphatase [Deltaproteobacteria bacterium]